MKRQHEEDGPLPGHLTYWQGNIISVALVLIAVSCLENGGFAVVNQILHLALGGH